MEVKGMVFMIGAMETVGTQKPMQKQQIVLQCSDGDRDKYVAIEFLGDKNVAKLGGIQIGDIVTVKVDLNSREWNGKWYTNANGWAITKHSAFAPPPLPQEDVFDQYRGVDVPAVKIMPATNDDEDLPF